MKHDTIIYHWAQAVGKAFAPLSKPQAATLAAASLGVAEARSCTLSRVAQKLFRLGSLPAVERRLQRFLSNERVDWKAGSICLAQWLLPGLLPGPKSKKPVVLLVDETALQEHLKIMVVALAWRGRALPLAWWCYPQDQYPLPQVELINTLLGQVAAALPPDRPVLVQADRGIGCSPDLMTAVAERRWFFLFRVQGSVRLDLGAGRQLRYAELIAHPGRCCAQAVRAFKKAGWVACRALGYWKAGQPEPWLLLTNWPAATTADYGLRMWEEAAFRDVKSNGFNWQRSHVYLPAHANRLWLILALAYGWVVSLGSQVREQTERFRQVAHGAKERFSAFQLGLRWLELCLNQGETLSYEPHFDDP
jgi:hypothetical protein